MTPEPREWLPDTPPSTILAASGGSREGRSGGGGGEGGGGGALHRSLAEETQGSEMAPRRGGTPAPGGSLLWDVWLLAFVRALLCPYLSTKDHLQLSMTSRDWHQDIPRRLGSMHMRRDYAGDWPSFPQQLKKLTIGHTFTGGSGGGRSAAAWPSQLRRLVVLGFKRQLRFAPAALPSTLRHLGVAHVPHEATGGGLGPLPDGLQSLAVHSLACTVLPKELQRLTIHDHMTTPLAPGLLPAGLQELSLGSYSALGGALTTAVVSPYAHLLRIEPGVIPATVWRLALGDQFNQVIEPGLLPRDLQDLDLGDRYNKAVPDASVWPAHLQRLATGMRCNRPLALPPGLRSLRVGWCYDQPLGRLPRELRKLKFDRGARYARPFAVGDLPPKLQLFSASGAFNQPLVAGLLPEALQVLRLGHDFNQPLPPGALPPALTLLQLGATFAQPLVAGSLPATLRKVVFVRVPPSLVLEPGALPSGLETLEWCGGRFEHWCALPTGLQELRLGGAYRYEIPAGALPVGLKRLVFEGHYAVEQLPPLPVGLEGLWVRGQCVRSGWRRSSPL